MAPSKRNRSVTLAKSPPGSPIRPITKRSRQITPESSASTTTLPIPLRPTRPTTTSTPTAFNSSQIDSESELSELESQSESEEESEEEEEDDITRANEYLDQDLEELGPDRLDREDMDESDVEKEVSEEFKTSKYFRQSIIDSSGNSILPLEKVLEIPTFGTYSLLIFCLI
jgi:hypothetical protein